MRLNDRPSHGDRDSTDSLWSIRFRHPLFAYLETNVFTHPALHNDLPPIMGNYAPDLLELVRFDHELK